VKARLARLAGRRLTKDGEIVIDARRYRTQERNRADARARFADLVRRATTPPKPRRPTRVPPGEKKKRREDKRRRAIIKARRTKPADE
jgi:ribosome-associated protein